MDDTISLFVIFVALSAALANISIWSPRKLWVKLSALGVTALMIPVGYASLAELLSRPKPVSMEWVRRAVPEAQLVGATMQEGKAIFLWLQMPDIDEPRSYTLPWSHQLAQQLQDAQREARRHRNGVRVNRPFDRDRDSSKRMFYATPQPPNPLKDGPNEAPLEFKQPQNRDN